MPPPFNPLEATGRSGGTIAGSVDVSPVAGVVGVVGVVAGGADALAGVAKSPVTNRPSRVETPVPKLNSTLVCVFGSSEPIKSSNDVPSCEWAPSLPA